MPRNGRGGAGCLRDGREGQLGVPDDRLGQRVAAAVVVAPGAAAPTVAALREHVAQTLDVTAAPREVHVVENLPRRGIGKVDRRALAARFTF